MTNLAAINTDWRKIGDTSLAVYEAEFRESRSPMLPDVRGIYEAAKPHSAMILAHLKIENQYATTGIYIKPEHRNPLSLRPEKPNDPGPYGSGVIVTPDTGQFLRFATWEDCIREWHRRTWKEAATYKGSGPYKNTTTLERYVSVYAPAGDVHGVTGIDNADMNYYGKFVSLLRQYASAEGQVEEREEAESMAFNIGNRPVRIAVGVGHANTSGGNQYELKKNREVMAELLKLVGASKGFDVRCYTPNNGQGNYPGTLDAVVYATVHQWLNQGWKPDIVFEIHHEGTGTPSINGGFIIYPDSVGLRGRKASGGDFVDVDVRTAGPEMARIITKSIGVGLRGNGIMSERSTGVGGQGWRLGYFGALSDPYFQQNAACFISEAATYTNPGDLAKMNSAGFAARQAKGLLEACAYLAKSRGKWTYAYTIGGSTPQPGPVGFKKGDTVTFTGRYNIRRAWNTNPTFEGKPNVVGVTDTDTVATIIGGPNVNDGYTWWDIRIEGFGTGHVIQDGMKKVDPKPAPEPTPEPEGDVPLAIPELDKYEDTAADVIPGAVDFTWKGQTYRAIYVGDRYQAKKDTPRYGTPNVNDPARNGGDIKATEAPFDVSWYVLNRTKTSEPDMLRTPWGTWVDTRDVVRVGDVSTR